MAEKNYVYIGEGEIKYLDKDETKLAAFLNVDIDKLIDELNNLRARNPDRKEALIYALPNKRNSYSVKLRL
jgi:hypothetical protein